MVKEESRFIGRIIFISVLLFISLGTLIINLYKYVNSDSSYQIMRVFYNQIYLLVLIPFGILFFKWIKKQDPKKWIHIAFLSYIIYGLGDLIFLRQIGYGGVTFVWVMMLILYVKYTNLLFSK